MPLGASALTGNPKVSASQLLKMEEHLGKDALDDSNDHNLFDDDPLIDVYMGLGQPLPSQRRGYQNFPVYTPKSNNCGH